MSYINKDNVSKLENRTLAEWKPLITDFGEINYNFGKNFDKWFDDRFNLRYDFIHCYSFINYHLNTGRVINNKNKIYVNKHTGQFFGGSKKIYNDFSEKELILSLENLNKFNNYCKKKNIKMYVVIFPQLNQYYKEEDIIHVVSKEDKTEKLIEYSKSIYNLDNIIYLKDYLKQYDNKEPIFYKTDHHLTDYGSYLVYKLLINRMKSDYPNLKLTPVNMFNITRRNLVRQNYDRVFSNGCEYNNLGFSIKSLLKTEYDFYDYKYLNDIRIAQLENRGCFKHFNKNGYYKLMIIGDSMQESMTYFLDTSFREIYKYRCNIKEKGKYPNNRRNEFDMEYWEKKIDEINPDIVILNRHSTGYDFSKMYKGVNK